jgi:hypothetical protein
LYLVFPAARDPELRDLFAPVLPGAGEMALFTGRVVDAAVLRGRSRRVYVA